MIRRREKEEWAGEQLQEEGQGRRSAEGSAVNGAQKAKNAQIDSWPNDSSPALSAPDAASAAAAAASVAERCGSAVAAAASQFVVILYISPSLSRSLTAWATDRLLLLLLYLSGFIFQDYFLFVCFLMFKYSNSLEIILFSNKNI